MSYFIQLADYLSSTPADVIGGRDTLGLVIYNDKQRQSTIIYMKQINSIATHNHVYMKTFILCKAFLTSLF